MSYNIATDGPSTTPVRTDIASWLGNYKEQNIEVSNDQTMLSMVTPDDSIVVVGPPRLTGNASDFFVVGMVSSFNYQEMAQVQPMKGIGSRRHMFSKTNGPVNGSIARMVFLGPNLYRALYALTSLSTKFTSRNSKFSGGNSGTAASWYHNIEEDLFRIPIGLGIIYNSPATMARGTANGVGAEYLESCVLNSRSIGLTAGSAMIMEQVSFIADRVIPWDAYSSQDTFSAGVFDNPVGTALA